MEASFNHSLVYEIESRPTVQAIVDSLLANEKLLHEAAFLFRDLASGVEIERVGITVRAVTQESPLTQVLIATLFLTYQEELVETVPSLFRDLTSLEIPERYHTLLTVLVMMIAVYGISKVIDRIFPDKKKQELDDNFRSLTVVAGDVINIAPKQIDIVVKKRFEGKKAAPLLSAAKNFFSPVIGRPGAQIVGPRNAKISSEAVAEIPSAAMGLLPPAEPESSESEFITNEIIIIHAMDRDRPKSGWAAHIPGRFEKRVRMKLTSGISPESIFGSREIRGDVIVLFEIMSDGAREPVEMTLLALR